MTKTLRDPDREPWEIVEETGDGGAIRNDGTVLAPMRKNRWYVLATLYDGQDGEELDEELAAKNRRAWNLWSCQKLDPERRAELAERMGLDEAELGGDWDAEREGIEQLFRDRLGSDAVMPDPGEPVDLSHTYLSKDTRVSFERYVFSANAIFQSATFSADANFRSSEFNGVTDFRLAEFRSHTPAFHACELYQDTRFTTEETHWPRPDVDTAEDNKSAYVRLRQLMNELHKPDDEHFFFRQEMRCETFLKEGWDRWIVQGFGWISDYGYGVTRPLLWLLGTIAAPGLLYTFAFAWQRIMDGVDRGVLEGFGLSVANTLAFLGLNRLYFGADYMLALPAWVKVVGTLQAVLGVIFLFFLGLGLRNRFRLK